MERLMVLRLQARGCVAEAWLNGWPLARVGPDEPPVTVPVHEYAQGGPNRLELVVEPDAPPPAPGAEPVAATHDRAARMALLLPRVGAVIDEQSVRTLGTAEWGRPAGETVTLPARDTCEVDLPVRFPRWRWLDAPVLEPTPALQRQALAFVQGLAADLARGQTESFLTATRLRTEELALAYQRTPQDETTRLRAALEAAHAAGRLVWPPLKAEGFALVPRAGGRLLECRGEGGVPALQTVPDREGQVLALPLRLSFVEGRFYVLR
jgi:hypothetical protein